MNAKTLSPEIRPAAPARGYTRAQTLPALLRERIVLMDGAMGTMIQQLGLTESHFRGERFERHPSELKGNNELLCLTQPEAILQVHTAYLTAGADVIETNTFGANAIAQAYYGLAHLAPEINVVAARLSRQACDAVATPGAQRWVAGAIGPTPRTTSISPDVNDPSARNTSFEGLMPADLAADTFPAQQRLDT